MEEFDQIDVKKKKKRKNDAIDVFFHRWICCAVLTETELNREDESLTFLEAFSTSFLTNMDDDRSE